MTQAFAVVGLPLVVTLLIETGVAALFGLGRRALGAVVALNLVTNPLISLVVISLVGFGIGFAGTQAETSGGLLEHAAIAPWFWAVLVLLEAAVVVAEWRGLVWALGRRRATSRRLFSVSLAMNLASGTVGTFLLAPLL